MELLLSTIHGSRLYGMAKPDSDYDWFEIYGFQKGRAKQRIAGSDDRTKAPYDRFMRYCEKGVPQYLEAMFSDMADYDNMPFDRKQYYHPGMINVRDTYFRTIKSFWLSGTENNDLKRKRHAMRLTLNLREMHGDGNGRFNPTMTPAQIDWIDRHARLPERIDPL